MAITNQPTPSHPKSPEPEQQPLQPGGVIQSNPRTEVSERPNVQVPESTGNEWREEKERKG